MATASVRVLAEANSADSPPKIRQLRQVSPLRAVPDLSQRSAPFLKWVGGKTRLLAQLTQLLPDGKYRYAEPFLGGGAMFFHLHNAGKLQHAVLADFSRDIVATNLAVKNTPKPLIAALQVHQSRYIAGDESERSEYFYAVRARHPSEQPMSDVERAARMLFLNRTCFNGLWRENASGRFNAPHGKYAQPNVVQEDRIWAAHRALQTAQIVHSDFRQLPELAKEHRLNFIYLDPPYHPLSATSSFNAYSGGQFSAQSQRELADVCRELDRAGVRWLLSNSDCAYVRDLYQDFSLHTVMAPRSINSKGDGRGEVGEVAICNY